MRAFWQAGVLAAAAVVAAAPMGPAAAEPVHPGETQGLGLTGPRTPDLLKDIAADPYRAPAEPACETIPAELVALNKVLGVDADEAKPRTSRVSQVRKAIVGAVRGMIPYRGEVRFLTRADHKEHQLMDATQAAWARRGFLRGLEANLHCSGDGATAATETDTDAGQVARLDLPPAAGGSAEPDAAGGPWRLPPPDAGPSDEPADGPPPAADPGLPQP